MLHAAVPNAAVAVYSNTPNPSPVTVTDPSPLRGAFRSTSDIAGESKLKMSSPVPTNPPTVTSVTRVDCPPELRENDPRHASDVDDSQDAVTHASALTATLAVYSLSPNCSPVTVTDPRPL